MKTDSTQLKFGRGNAKLDKTIITFSLPAGWSCPGAKLCMAKANRETGKLTDGSNQEFRCFAASAEAAFPGVRESRWHNMDLLKGRTREQMYGLIMESLPADTSIVTHPCFRGFLFRALLSRLVRRCKGTERLQVLRLHEKHNNMEEAYV